MIDNLEIVPIGIETNISTDNSSFFSTHPELRQIYDLSVATGNDDLQDAWAKLINQTTPNAPNPSEEIVLEETEKPKPNGFTSLMNRRNFMRLLGAVGATVALNSDLSPLDRPKPKPLPIDRATTEEDKRTTYEILQKTIPNPFSDLEFLDSLGMVHAREDEEVANYMKNVIGNHFQGASLFYAENDPKWEHKQNELVYKMSEDILQFATNLDISPIALTAFMDMSFVFSKVGVFHSKKYDEDVSLSRIQYLLSQLIDSGLVTREQILYSLTITPNNGELDSRQDT